MLCIYYLLWGIVLEIGNEVTIKNLTRRYYEQKHATMSRKICDLTMDNNAIIHRKQQD